MWTVAGAAAAAGAAGIFIAISLSSDRTAERRQIEELRRQFEEQRKRAEQPLQQEPRKSAESPKSREEQPRTARAPIPKKPNSVSRQDAPRQVPKAELTTA